jgi:anthranilate phosphoribosyltransferase
MKSLLEALLNHQVLTRSEAFSLLEGITSQQLPPAQIAAVAAAFRLRSPSLEELGGFREALLSLGVKVDLNGYDTIDVCGTGGDGKHTFNISTLTAFVVAGAGMKVAKHGNYGVSSACGSSNVLEYLGVKPSNDPDLLKRSIESSGVCYMHAPLFHPAMKAVAPVRKELGLKTFFNMLGPLVNPARPKYQLIGVYNLELLRSVSYLLQAAGAIHLVLHTLDGYDEVSLTAPVRILGTYSDALLNPASFKASTLSPSEISGGSTVEEAAKIFMSVLEGTSTEAQRAVVLGNSALALQLARPETSLEDCLGLAAESLRSGAALKSFNTFTNLFTNNHT